ncbi:hypothetical protein Hanom_Chr02g00168591 [Helianthus anomalus]
MLAMGKQKSKFASWLGLTLRARFPYHIPTKNLTRKGGKTFGWKLRIIGIF